MNYLVTQGYPSRVARQALGAWSAALGVEVSAGDYALLNAHRLTAPAPRPPEGGG